MSSAHPERVHRGTGASVLRSKLRPGAVAAALIRRPRLLEWLDEAIGAPLTLVDAPAGSGKTSLLASWAADTDTPTAWLSLDEADRDAVQLWTGIIAALESVLPDRGERAIAVLQRPGPVGVAVGTLLEDLEPEREATVLVLDDVHIVDAEPAAADSLTLFLRHLPTWLHVIMLSRRTPRLPVSQLRARGQLSEIHFSELGFSPVEAEEMLSRLAPSLPTERVVEAARQAGGWAAGIQLVALAIRSSKAQFELRRTGDAGALLVNDYVWQEVMASEDPEIVDALLQTSVVERVNSSLAQALTGRPDAGELLARGEARGLFITRLDASGWYQIHPLIREVLLRDLERRSAAGMEEQHGLAARWFEESDHITLALEHWLLAHRYRDALRLLAAHTATLYDSGRGATLERVLAQVPLSVAARDVSAMVEYAWCHVLVSRQGFLQAADQASDSAKNASELAPTERGRLSVLQAAAALQRGNWTEGGLLARRAKSELAEGWWLDPIGRFVWNLIARDTALSERWDHSGLEVAEATRESSSDPERRLDFEGTRALGEALAGRPLDALRIAAGIRRAAELANMTILRVELSTAEAIAHRELGDRGRALAELTALAETPLEPVPYCGLLVSLELTLARVEDGDLAEADRMFAGAMDLVETDFAGPGARSWLARVGSRRALAAGDLTRARGWVEQISDPFWAEATSARILLAEGRGNDASTTLERATPRCLRHEVIRDLLRCRTAPGRDESLKWAIAAAELAASHGMLQTVAAEGPDVLNLIEAAAWRLPQAWLDRLRRVAVPRLSPNGERSLRRPVEGLTERERDVLRLMPSRLTLREIADELHISVNTLKFHLKVIYRKLDVSSRAEAAEAARAMGRIPHPGQASTTLPR
jgi:LuxR family maltose regulon positive regulatory protein